MKRFVLLLFVLIFYTKGFGQNVSLESDNPRGWVSAMSLDVQTNDQIVKFENGADYAARKILPNYFQLTVKAPRPAQWVITASLSDVYSVGNSPTNTLENLVRLRTSQGQIFTITNTPQVILQSNSNIPANQFGLDLLVDPPFNRPSGIMPGMINFRLELL